MFYKRKEMFRYTFGEPLQAVLWAGNDKTDCSMIDISPGGSKVYAEGNFVKGSEVELHFVLLEETIKAPGIVVWKQASREGALYGVDFIEDATLEEQIVNQLKFRRRTEKITK